jgi:hypothetical protein
MTGFAAVRESGFGTRLTKPDVAACPQPGEGGIRLPERVSRLTHSGHCKKQCPGHVIARRRS